MAMAKKRVTVQSKESTEERFAELLTPYALNYVEKQIALQKVTSIQDHGENCTVSSSAGTLTVTAESCQCTFWKTMYLPCRHIFAAREKMHLPLFSTTGVSERWKMTYMREVYAKKTTSTPGNSFQAGAVCFSM